MAMMRGFLVLIALCFVATAAHAAPNSVRPTQLIVRFEAEGALLHEVMLAGKELRYTRFNPATGKNKKSTITPTANEYAAFRTQLDALGAWNWQENYANPNILCGGAWEFVAVYPDKVVRSAGSNAFPGTHGWREGEADPTKEFNQLIVAVQALIHDTHFQYGYAGN